MFDSKHKTHIDVWMLGKRLSICRGMFLLLLFRLLPFLRCFLFLLPSFFLPLLLTKFLLLLSPSSSSSSFFPLPPFFLFLPPSSFRNTGEWTGSFDNSDALSVQLASILHQRRHWKSISDLRVMCVPDERVRNFSLFWMILFLVFTYL